MSSRMKEFSASKRFVELIILRLVTETDNLYYHGIIWRVAGTTILFVVFVFVSKNPIKRAR